MGMYHGKFFSNNPLYSETDKFYADENDHFVRCADPNCLVCAAEKERILKQMIEWKSRKNNNNLSESEFNKQKLRYMQNLTIEACYSEKEVMDKLKKGEKISLGV